MNESKSENKACIVCLAEGAEFGLYKDQSKWILKSICTRMTLEVSQVSFTCFNCFYELMDLNIMKAIWSVNEGRIRTKVIHVGHRISLTELLFPNLPIKYEIANICRLCLIAIVDGNSSSKLSTQIDNISFAEMFQYALPDFMLDATYSPIFCGLCAEKLQLLYKVNKKYMETEMKIKSYLEITGTTLRSIDNIHLLLLNVKRHFQNTTDVLIPKPSDFYIHFCGICDYKSLRRRALLNHKITIHPVECILGDDTSPEASESGALEAIINGGELSINPVDIVNGEEASITLREPTIGGETSIHPINVIGEKASITTGDMVIGGEASVITLSNAAIGGETSIHPIDVIGEKATITTGDMVIGGEASVNTLSNAAIGGETSIHPIDVIGEKASITTGDMVIGGEASVITLSNAAIGGETSIHPIDVIGEKATITTGDMVIGGEASVNTLSNAAIGGETSIHPIDVIGEKASITTGDMVIGGEASVITLSNAAIGGETSIHPVDVIGEKASITTGDMVIGGEASIITLSNAAIGGETSNTPVNYVIGGKASITTGDMVNGGGSSVTPREAVNAGKSSEPSSTGNVDNSIPGDTKSVNSTGICSTSSDMGNSEKKFKCTMCDVYATHKKCNLKQHIARHNKRHNCHICDFKGTTKKALVRHNLEHFPDIAHSFRCHKCSYCTATRTNLSKHLLRHEKKEMKAELN